MSVDRARDAGAASPPGAPPLYIAAYDTESARCVPALPKIVAMHEKYALPATFFLVAGLLDEHGAEIAAALKDHPLFEIACHTYTHMILADTMLEKAGPPERLPQEIIDSKQRIEDVFGRAVIGFRPPYCYPDGMKSAPGPLRLIHQAGYQYVSSRLWGPEWSMPSLLSPPHTYADEGFPDLWELPACGWHENVLKRGYGARTLRLLLFPAPMPEATPLQFVTTPEEEFRVNNQPFIDKAIATAASHVSLIWHPWSLNGFDPEMRMLDLTFRHVCERGLRVGTFADLLDKTQHVLIGNGHDSSKGNER